VISALILAAGQSRRMGQPKMRLPWGDRTVLGQVIHIFKAAGVEDVLVVTGGDSAVVESIAKAEQAKTVFNPDFAGDEMLGSLQVGLRAMTEDTEATLIALGDQPQIQERTVRSIVDEYLRTSAALIVPSYRMRRGHPWLVARKLWDSILRLQAPESPRDFLHLHADEIHYVELDTLTVLQDLDTPEDYLKSRS
jgi:molybdenum cofactor cytidylyltransferase